MPILFEPERARRRPKIVLHRHLFAHTGMLLAATTLILSIGCASSVRVNSDFDPQADFKALSTWDWVADMPAAAGATLAANPLTRDRISRAVEQTLAAKGFRRDPRSPSFRVGFAAAIEDSLEVRSVPTTTVHTTSWRGRRGGYTGWTGSTTDVRQVTEGTLVIDVVQPDGERLIWRGSGVSRLREQRDPHQRTKAINDAVSRILSQFPPK